MNTLTCGFHASSECSLRSSVSSSSAIVLVYEAVMETGALQRSFLSDSEKIKTHFLLLFCIAAPTVAKLMFKEAVIDGSL